MFDRPWGDVERNLLRRPSLYDTRRRKGCRAGKQATHRPVWPSKSVQKEAKVMLKVVFLVISMRTIAVVFSALQFLESRLVRGLDENLLASRIIPVMAEKIPTVKTSITLKVVILNIILEYKTHIGRPRSMQSNNTPMDACIYHSLFSWAEERHFAPGADLFHRSLGKKSELTDHGKSNDNTYRTGLHSKSRMEKQTIVTIEMAASRTHTSLLKDASS